MVVPVVCRCDAVHVRSSTSDSVKRVEVAVFEGGYGIEWHKKVAAEYTKQFSAKGVVIGLWGEPRVVEKIKPRLLRGDPPDLVVATGVPMWLLIGAGKLVPFDAALRQPAFGADVPWGDLFVPGTLDTFKSGGHVYALPTGLSAWGCWYDARLFREHGWNVPGTWSQFCNLCEAAHAAAIPPIAFQGKYPGYAWSTFICLVQRVGGLAAINRINAMESGAFSHPDVVRAAGLAQDMAVRYFQRGAMAMTHTESQLQFVNNQAAMIFCGVWLENEMKNCIPPGFEMRCFNVPAVEAGKGNPNLCNGSGGEFLFVPADARYPDEAIAFARYLISPANAGDMTATIGNPSSLKGCVNKDTITPALRSAVDMIENSPGIFDCRLPTLLLEWEQQVKTPLLASLLRGEIAPEDFCRRLDEGIAAARANPDIIIPEYVPYAPAAFGERDDD